MISPFYSSVSIMEHTRISTFQHFSIFSKFIIGIVITTQVKQSNYEPWKGNSVKIGHRPIINIKKEKP